MARVIHARVSGYNPYEEINYERIGVRIDAHLREHFTGYRVLICPVSLSLDHCQVSLDDLIASILVNGTDVSDSAPKLKGEEKVACDLFADEVDLEKQRSITARYIRDFSIMPPTQGKPPSVVDFFLVYDREQLTVVPYTQNGKVKTDAYIFNDSEKKQESLLGIVQVHVGPEAPFSLEPGEYL